MNSGTVITVAALLLAATGFYYNRLVGKRNLAEQAFSTIDVMLKKRCDLIPNLVASVQRYAIHEAATLARISELRSRMRNDRIHAIDRLAADNEVNPLIKNLLFRMEQYPELQANAHFLQLQTALNDIETQLSAARRTFNAAATLYNYSTEMFPGLLFAGLFGFKRIPLLDGGTENRNSPAGRSLFTRRKGAGDSRRPPDFPARDALSGSGEESANSRREGRKPQ